MMIALFAALGAGNALAQDSTGTPGPKHHLGKPHPCKDSAQCKLMHEGMELRKAEMQAHKAYVKALEDNKDVDARKADLLSAMDKVNEFQKAHVEDQARFMIAHKNDTTWQKGGHGDWHGKHGGNGPGPHGPGGPDGQGGPGMPPPPPQDGEFHD
jgi:hypothetical protein